MIAIEEINKYDDVLKLKDLWSTINENGPDEVSLSFEWIISVWESHLNKDDAIILLFKKEERVIGIVPLYKKIVMLYKYLPVVHIGMMSNIYCNHNDFIISEDREDCLEAMFRYFEKKRFRWDLFDFCDFVDTSPNLDILKELSNRYGFGIKEVIGDNSPYLPIEGSFDDFLAKKKSKKRRDLISEVSKIQSLGTIEVKRYCGDGPLEPVMNAIYGIEKKSWKEIERSSITASTHQTEFYRLFAESVNQKKWLYINFLELNGEAIAYLYLIKYRNRIFDLKGTYVEAYKDYSPGKVLIYCLIKELYNKDINELDFLGKAEPWKMNWTNLVRNHKSLFIYNKKSYINLLYTIKIIYDKFAEFKNNGIKYLFKKIVNKCFYILFHKVQNILYFKEIDDDGIEIKLKINNNGLPVKIITKYDESIFIAVQKIRPNEERQKWFNRFNRNDVCFMVITPDKEVIHMIWACYKEIETINVIMNKNMLLKDKEFYIHDAFTNELYRGQSIYPYMLSYIMKYHRDMGFKRAFLDVRSLNLPSIRGVEKAGFKKDRIFTLYVLLDCFKFVQESL